MRVWIIRTPTHLTSSFLCYLASMKPSTIIFVIGNLMNPSPVLQCSPNFSQYHLGLFSLESFPWHCEKPLKTSCPYIACVNCASPSAQVHCSNCLCVCVFVLLKRWSIPVSQLTICISKSRVVLYFL